jgi:radical SAM superfamily enzyme YgiQ (UPF0313 family)
MKVLLIYPQFPDTFWSGKYALRFIRKKASSPPLGLLTVAALLPANWPRRLVDTNVSRLTASDLAWADIAFISAMTVQRESARSIISRCRAAGVKTVAGGPLFSSDYEQFEQVDHFVLNEGELTLPPFLADLAQGQAQRLYSAAAFADIRQTPAPLWSLVDMNRYAQMSVQFSRGCPYDCDFCNVTALFGRRPRIKSVQQVIAELDDLYRLGWRSPIFFVDDNLIGNKRYFKQALLPALVEWQRDKEGIVFHSQVTITLADDEPLMEMMVAAGFNAVFIGIETPDEASLAECSKQQNKNRDLVADVKRIQRAGLEVRGGFIVGFDHDTPAIFQRQIDFIQESGIVTAMVGLLQAPPGTRLYRRLRGEGRLLDRMSGDNVDGTSNIIPLMNPDVLLEGYQRVLHHLYAPEYYYQRVRTFLGEYQMPALKTKPQLQHVLAFVRSVYVLGLVGKERSHYWRLLLWTLFRRPRQLPVAVALAIWGYHFRKICELHLP